MAGWSEADDWVLLRAARHQPQALDALYRRHRDYVHRLAWGFLGNRDLAGDVVQEVFLRLVAPRLRWRPRAAFHSWLYRVVLNVSREQRRIGARELTGSEACLDGRADGRTAEDDQRLTELATLLETLPQRQREVVVLRILEGLSTRETATVMRCREGTVKAHLHRATVSLRQRLESDIYQRPRRRVIQETEG